MVRLALSSLRKTASLANNVFLLQVRGLDLRRAPMIMQFRFKCIALDAILHTNGVSRCLAI